MTNLVKFFNDMLEKNKLEWQQSNPRDESIVAQQMRTHMRDIIPDTPTWGFKEIMSAEMRRLGI